jgi:hypothetical protein
MKRMFYYLHLSLFEALDVLGVSQRVGEDQHDCGCMIGGDRIKFDWCSQKKESVQD